MSGFFWGGGLPRAIIRLHMHSVIYPRLDHMVVITEGSEFQVLVVASRGEKETG